MQITSEYLRAHIRTMREMIASYNGAIQFAEALLQELEAEQKPDDSLAVNEFAEMVAGQNATASIEPVHTNNRAHK